MKPCVRCNKPTHNKNKGKRICKPCIGNFKEDMKTLDNHGMFSLIWWRLRLAVMILKFRDKYCR